MRQIVMGPALVMVAALGCGEGAGTDVMSADGPTRFTGADAVLLANGDGLLSLDEAGNAVEVTSFQVALFDRTGSCGALVGRVSRPGTTDLVASVVLPRGQVLRPGAYSLLGGVGSAMPPFATAFLTRLDSRCAPEEVPDVVSGTLQLEDVAGDPAKPTRVSGRVDVSLRDGTHVRGSFEAAGCDARLPGFPSVEAKLLPDGGTEVTAIPDFTCQGP